MMGSVERATRPAVPSLRAADNFLSDIACNFYENGPLFASSEMYNKTQIAIKSASKHVNKSNAFAALHGGVAIAEGAVDAAGKYYSRAVVSEAGRYSLEKFLRAVKKDTGHSWDTRFVMPLAYLYSEIDGAARDDLGRLYTFLDRDGDGSISSSDLHAVSSSMFKALIHITKKSATWSKRWVVRAWMVILRALMKLVDKMLPPEPKKVFMKPKQLLHQISAKHLSDKRLSMFGHGAEEEYVTLRQVLEIILKRIMVVFKRVFVQARSAGLWIGSYIGVDPVGLSRKLKLPSWMRAMLDLPFSLICITRRYFC